MAGVFKTVLETGFQGGILILAVLLLRLVLRKAPRRYFGLLWLLVGLRLLVPVQIESELSLQPNAVQMAQLQEQILPTPGGLTGEAVQAMPRGGWMEPAAYVWLAGAAALAAYGLVSCLRLKWRLREAVKLTAGVWEQSGLETAFILGWLKPRIYLPAGLSDPERAFILDHEYVHLQRGDHWSRLAGFAAVAVHWFNPLVWVAYTLFCRDVELACDERVVRSMPLEQRKAYSAALLKCSAGRGHFAACPVAFGETSVRQRILAVLRYRKPRFWLSAAAVLVAAVTAVCFLTTRVERIDPTTLENWGITLRPESSDAWGVTVVYDYPDKIEGRFVFNFSDWALQTESDGRWVDVPMVPQKEPEMPWNGCVSMLAPFGRIQRIHVDWTTVYGQLPPGQYRIRGSVMLYQEEMGYAQDFYTQFVIATADAQVTQPPEAAP